MVSAPRLPAVILVDDPDVQRYLDSLRSAIQELMKVPFIAGAVIKDQTVSTSTLKLDHKLGRPFEGVFALDGTGLIVDDSNPHPERQIWLTIASGSRTLDLWVF